MIKNEMLAYWVYKKGELARLRFMEKKDTMAFVGGAVLFIALLCPMLLLDAAVFNEITGWVIGIAFLTVPGIVYYTLQLCAGMLFKLVTKFINTKLEEVLITSSKIITERQTWIISDDRHLLSTVEVSNKLKQAAIVFKGKVLDNKKATKLFTIILPVPPEEHRSIEKICNCFKQLLKNQKEDGYWL